MIEDLLKKTVRARAGRVGERCLLVALLLVAGRASRAAAQGQPSIAIDAPSWHLESSSNGIDVFSSSVIGTAIVPFKAVMTILGTIEDVSMVLEDIPRRGEWISNFGMSVLLDRTNDYAQTEYLRVAMPWPARDRRALIRVRISGSDDLTSATIAAESVDAHWADTLPVLVRSRVYASTFQMTQVADHVEVAALVFIDPRGRIPKWIVNFFTRRVARATLNGLRRQVARKLYSPQKLEAIHQRMQAYPLFREQRSVAPRRYGAHAERRVETRRVAGAAQSSRISASSARISCAAARAMTIACAACSGTNGSAGTSTT